MGSIDFRSIESRSWNGGGNMETIDSRSYSGGEIWEV